MKTGILTALKMPIMDSWDVPIFRLVQRDQHFSLPSTLKMEAASCTWHHIPEGCALQHKYLSHHMYPTFIEYLLMLGCCNEVIMDWAWNLEIKIHTTFGWEHFFKCSHLCNKGYGRKPLRFKLTWDRREERRGNWTVWSHLKNTWWKTYNKLMIGYFRWLLMRWTSSMNIWIWKMSRDLTWYEEEAVDKEAWNREEWFPHSQFRCYSYHNGFKKFKSGRIDIHYAK